MSEMTTEEIQKEEAEYNADSIKVLKGLDGDYKLLEKLKHQRAKFF